eukprot:CAMPEP_0114607968 /NCGR_PEP_ID=MMETSP0168-20121206/2337_1 /TAXON_ID=95228 ORGANISM="Vannella sp., Strain DIVA3 517/6/12" /NCGR_SAMPLE_ID=MMETSP0168 /ASSEMBLY_ACC=CAM_ASM_000044 /LENGTH=324 /DNA_ID=CAMNT_0001818853 /DNA_START=21 /DNA_END=992 /DNA_ORIENTATION=-
MLAARVEIAKELETIKASIDPRKVIVVLAYIVVSISITFFNKAVLSGYDFHYANTLSLVQVLCSSTLLLWLRRMNVPRNAAPLSLKHARACLPLAICFAGMLVTGLSGLQYSMLLAYSAWRGAVPLVVLLCEQIFLRSNTSPSIVGATVMIVGGMVIGNLLEHLTVSALGMSLIAANCVFTALYLVLIKKISRDLKLDSLTLMLYNDILSLPSLLLLVIWSELGSLTSFGHWTSPLFLMCLLMSVGQSFLLNLFIFLCTTINTALTTSVAAESKNLLITMGALVVTTEPTLSMWMGVSISLLGTVWFLYSKYVTAANAALQQAS